MTGFEGTTGRHSPEDPAVLAADTPAEERAATQSLGDIVGDLTRDFSTLMRDELALAKAEATEQAKHAGKGAGMLGGAAYAGGLVIFFLSYALAWALGDLFDSLGWSALLVGVLWAVAAGVMAAMGRTRMKQVTPLAPRTVDTTKDIPEALKGHETR